MSNLTWKEILNAHTEKRSEMKAPALVSVIVALHVSVLGAFVFIQGCGTTHPPRPVVVDPPPPPPMPTVKKEPPPVRPAPSFKPPVAPAVAPVNFDPATADTYVIQKGDSLSKIAARHGMSSRDLAAINKITDPNKIRVGQKLILPPGSGVMSTPAPVPSASSAPRVSTPSGAVHVVQKGDSLSKIARQYGISAKDLAALNGISDPNRIRIGQKLNLPGANSAPVPPAPAPAPAPRRPEPRSPAPAPAPVVPESFSAPAPAAPAPPVSDVDEDAFQYLLRDGETLRKLAMENGTTVEAIMELNGISDEASVKAGDLISIPMPGGM